MPKFEKGGKRPPDAGRKVGSTNKTTGVLKEAILLAAQQVGDLNERGRDGLVGYLRFLACNYPQAYVSLLGRVLPLQVRVDGQTEVTYRTVVEVEREMASRGFPIEEVTRLLTQAAQPEKEGGHAEASADDQADDAGPGGGQAANDGGASPATTWKILERDRLYCLGGRQEPELENNLRLVQRGTGLADEFRAAAAPTQSALRRHVRSHPHRRTRLAMQRLADRISGL
jgi:hypothetical protein